MPLTGVVVSRQTRGQSERDTGQFFADNWDGTL